MSTWQNQHHNLAHPKGPKVLLRASVRAESEGGRLCLTLELVAPAITRSLPHDNQLLRITSRLRNHRFERESAPSHSGA